MKKSALPKSRAKTAYGLLSEIRKLILAEPKRYNQLCWRTREGDDAGEYDAPLGFPPCGTVACIAGWITTFKAPRAIYFADAAQRTLGLTHEQAGELFDEAAAGARDSKQTLVHAQAGAAHIARFQQKYAAQLKAKAV